MQNLSIHDVLANSKRFHIESRQVMNYGKTKELTNYHIKSISGRTIVYGVNREITIDDLCLRILNLEDQRETLEKQCDSYLSRLKNLANSLQEFSDCDE